MGRLEQPRAVGCARRSARSEEANPAERATATKFRALAALAFSLSLRRAQVGEKARALCATAERARDEEGEAEGY